MGFIFSIYRVEFHFLNFRGSSGFRVQMFCLHKDSLAAPSSGISYLETTSAAVAQVAALQDKDDNTSPMTHLVNIVNAAMQDAGKGMGKGKKGHGEGKGKDKKGHSEGKGGKGVGHE